MSFYVNGPDTYQGPSPLDGANVVPPASLQPAPALRDGLYFRRDIAHDPAVLAEAINGDGGTVQDYQYWAETGWKTAHGTHSSVARFGRKLDEERAELAQAAVDFLREPDEAHQRDVVSELGDVLLCLTALTSNASASIDSSLKLHLYQYVMGIQWIDRRGETIEPTWRPLAASMATKFGQIAIAEVDELIEAGFVPLPSPVMNVFDPDDPEDMPTLFDWSSWLVTDVAVLRGLAEQQYAWGGARDTERVSYMMLPDGFRNAAQAIGQQAAKFYLEAAYVARHDLGATLSSVMRANVAKIMPRIAQRLIDKTDGPRNAG